MPPMSFNARATAIAVFIALPLFGQVAEGDRHYAARAERGRIDTAIAAYQRAVAANGNDLEAHWKLLRAYRFKGAYEAASTEQKKQIYGAAKAAGEKALAAVHRRLGVNERTGQKQVADAARTVPGAAEVFLWDAINWGEWALAYGKMAAARQGAADRILRGATIAHLSNPRLEGGAPSRVLGRLHHETPRIPFVTGWASAKEAVRFLRQSQKIAPDNKLTLVFLAEALAPTNKSEAVQLLQRAINTPNHPDYAVEDAAAVEDAKALLAKM